MCLRPGWYMDFHGLDLVHLIKTRAQNTKMCEYSRIRIAFKLPSQRNQGSDPGNPLNNQRESWRRVPLLCQMNVTK